VGHLRERLWGKSSHRATTGRHLRLAVSPWSRCWFANPTGFDGRYLCFATTEAVRPR
jgi:hypothetical protein